MKFVFVRLSGPLSSFHLVILVIAVLTGSDAMFGNLGLCPLCLGFSTGAEGWNELDTVFVESQRMSEVDDGIVRTGEWQVFWNQADGLDGVPAGDVRLVIDRWV